MKTIAKTKIALPKRIWVFLLYALAALIGSNTARAVTIFSDNFTGSTLNPAWQVLPGQGSYTVGGGQLQYYNDGPQTATTGWYNAALTLALPLPERIGRSTPKPPSTWTGSTVRATLPEHRGRKCW